MRAPRSIVLVSLIALTAGFVSITASPASAARSCVYFDFDKGTNINSTIKWSWYDDFGRCLYYASWRAGSGTTTDPCQVGQGWLPNGWWDLNSVGMDDDYLGSLIEGRVWGLQDKQCASGTWRTEMFIHTEEERDWSQTCTSAADDLHCWDSTKADSGAQVGSNDYKSNGCVKIRRKSPEGNWANDHASAHNTYHNHGAAGHNVSRSDTLYVHT